MGFSTLLDWRRRYPEFREAYRLAQEAAAELLVGEALEIADTDASRMAKNRIAIRQWLAERLNDFAYGDRQALTVQAETFEDRLRRLSEGRASPAASADQPVAQESDGSATITDCASE